MGVLTRGKPIIYTDTSPEIREYVKKHGIRQFLENYVKHKDRVDEDMKWGDEIEYSLVWFDDDKQEVYLSLNEKVLEDLGKDYEAWKKDPDSCKTPGGIWQPEYGKYMVEATPLAPYESSLSSLMEVEKSMESRRLEVHKHLNLHEKIVPLTFFPLMGSSQVKKFTEPYTPRGGEFSQSCYISDEIISSHPRFGALTRNIRLRKGHKVCILVPLYLDENTDRKIGIAQPMEEIEKTLSPIEPSKAISIPKNGKKVSCSTIEQLYDETVFSENASFSPTFCSKFLDRSQPFIHMDAMGFGMGCGCQQNTFLTRDIQQARHLYDMLVPICPIFLSLTAATPIVRGLLANTDARWNIVSASVDDRQNEEKTKIRKSRYDSVSLYISQNEMAKRNSDIKAERDEKIYQKLLKANVDQQLAAHIAHLFVRDPLVIFTDYDKVDDKTRTDHFENIQSTNWQSVRFKPPPSQNSEIGWRVEFRVSELQLTSFENAAFAVFVMLLVKTILKFNLNFYMPISLVDRNMCFAHMIDSITHEKFYFPTNLQNGKEDSSTELLTIKEIVNGSKKFEGLIPLVRKYLAAAKKEGQLCENDHKGIERYLHYVSKRASGELITLARYMRNFVHEHPSYQRDSIVNQSIAYDLLKEMSDISEYKKFPESLLPKSFLSTFEKK